MVGLLVVGGQVAKAEACSAVGCGPLKVTEAGDVPANLPGLTFTRLGSLLGVEATLENVDSGEAIAVESLLRDEVEGMQSTLVFLRPESPFEAGVSYRLTLGSEGCEDTVVEYEGTEALALPQALGELSAGDAEHGLVQVASSGPCSEEIDAVSVRLELELSADAEPWLPFLDVVTYVDGEPWKPWHDENEVPEPGATWEGRGVDRLYAGCGSEPHGLQEGMHEVHVVATLPGSDLELTTTAIDVELRCPTAGGDDAPAGGEPPTGNGAEAERESSGGCSVGGGQIGGAAGWLTLLAGLLLARRRRTR